MTDLNPTTPLEHAVNDWYQENVEEEYTKCLEDLSQHGCISGMVGGLIYYTDTTAFYLKHQKEIDALAYELADSCGCRIDELLRGWDTEDPFARETTNQNILAWFGFEETARNLAGAARRGSHPWRNGRLL